MTINQDGVIIAVMGATGTGKTTFINLVSGSNLRVGMGLDSCTSEVETSLPFTLGGRHVILIDTPGFNDTTQSDTIILRLISDFLSQQYAKGIKLAGVIYMHCISDFRMGGISRRNFSMFRQLCGDSTLKNVVIVTNMWGDVSKEIGEAREAELASSELFFKPVLDKEARFVRHGNTLESAHAILRLLVGNKPEALRIQREIVDEKKDSSQTAAAAALEEELREQARRHEEERRRVQAEMEADMRRQEEQRRAQEAERQRQIQEEIARVEAEARRRAAEQQAEKARIQWEMEAAAERARAAAERQRQLREEAEHAQWQAQAEAAERAELARRLAEEQQRQAELERQRAHHDDGGCIVM